MRRLICGIALLLVLMGCGSAGQQDAANGGTAVTSTTPAQTPTPAPTTRAPRSS